MPEQQNAIDRYTRVAVEIIESLDEIKPGQTRCLYCGHTTETDRFEIGDPSFGGKGGSESHRYCPKCKRSITWRGHVWRDQQGNLHKAA